MEILRIMESIRTPFLDTVIGLVTRLGEETVGVVILCAIFWCISKRAAYRIGIAFFLSGLSVQGMKICFRIERPWVASPGLKPVASALENATGYSFPSGHAQSAAVLFGSLGLQIKQKSIKALCFSVVLLVAFSRVYLGVHTLLDVVTSILISLLIVLLIEKFYNFDTVNIKRELIISLIMILYAVTVIVIALALYSSAAIEHNYVADCLKAAGAGVGFAAGIFIERVYIDFQEKTGNILWQIIKFILGFAGLLAIKEGLKLIIGNGLAADMIRYFIMLAWITVLFPLIIKRFFTVKK